MRRFERIRPLDSERESGRRWRIETIVLLAIAAVIAIAAVYDLTREVKSNNRLTADIETWRSATGIPAEEVAVEQDLATYSTRDTACASVWIYLKYSPRICVMLVGPVVDGRRKVAGGFYLPPFLPIGPNDRYGCFGSTVAEKFCFSPNPITLPSAPPKGFGGGT